MLSCHTQTNFRLLLREQKVLLSLSFSSALCPVSSATSSQFKLRHGLLWEVFPYVLPSPTAGCMPQPGIQGGLHSMTVYQLVCLD